MPRYVTLRQKSPARGWDDFERYDEFGRSRETWVQPLGQPSVYDAGPVDTGLLDKDGNRIYRTADQIGFVERK